MSRPHFVLSVDAQVEGSRGRWRFRLGPTDGHAPWEVADRESVDEFDAPERLELLALVRALEALDEPSHVTLVGASSHVRRGLMVGLDEWPNHDWCWESFGQMVPVPHADLWRRVEHARRFHRIDCRHRFPRLPHSRDGHRTIYSGRLNA